MANAVATFALGSDLNAIDTTERSIILRGTVTVGASPLQYVAAGILADLTVLGDALKSSKLPTSVKMWSMPSTASPETNLYIYLFCLGTAQNNGKMQIYTGAAAQTALTELSAGNIPAGVSGDVIQFEAVFPRY